MDYEFTTLIKHGAQWLWGLQTESGFFVYGIGDSPDDACRDAAAKGYRELEDWAH